MPQIAPRGPILQRAFRTLLRAPVRRLWPWALSGYEAVPENGPAVLCANHLSFFDSVLMIMTIDRPIYFIGKADYLDSWRTRRLFPAMGMIPIDRDSGTRAMVALDAAADVLRDGALLCVFPEGTRSHDGHLHRGYIGAARVAITVGCPILPVGIVGTARDSATRGAPAPTGSVFDLDRRPTGGDRRRVEQSPQRGQGIDQCGDGTHRRAVRPAVRRRAHGARTSCRRKCATLTATTLTATAPAITRRHARLPSPRPCLSRWVRLSVLVVPRGTASTEIAPASRPGCGITRRVAGVAPGQRDWVRYYARVAGVAPGQGNWVRYYASGGRNRARPTWPGSGGDAVSCLPGVERRGGAEREFG